MHSSRSPAWRARLGRWAIPGGIGAAVGLGALLTAPGVAQPPAPAAFCEVYAGAPACAAGEVSCDTCHVAPPRLNAYGADVAARLVPSEARPLHADVFTAGLADALIAVEGLDSDGDGYLNGEEIDAGTSPADEGSVPVALPCVDADPGDPWDLCGYDPDYAFKKVMLDFCGMSPSYAERQAFLDASDPSRALHDQLDACLDTEFWRGIGGKVWNLANRKIGPQQAVKSGKGAGPIPLADYDDDYAYFVWTQTDDRDVRLVLTGKSFVDAGRVDGATVYTEWTRTPQRDIDERGFDVAQLVQRRFRAGMLTHRWFLMSNTMFTAIPRTTAAQAYRAYLGYDIALLEGLAPVSAEPVDYDSKGVDAEDCAVCHSTLDPLSYPFSRYEGIGGGMNVLPYSYNPRRLQGFVDTDGALVAETPEEGVLFGQPVTDLVEWAEVAANSEAFRRATVLDYWRLLLREDPRPSEQLEFAELVEGLGTDHGWRVESMLHDLVDTEAYGAP